MTRHIYALIVDCPDEEPQIAHIVGFAADAARETDVKCSLQLITEVPGPVAEGLQMRLTWWKPS